MVADEIDLLPCDSMPLILNVDDISFVGVVLSEMGELFNPHKKSRLNKEILLFCFWMVLGEMRLFLF